MGSEQKPNPIASLVHKVPRSQSRPETSEQLTAELQKRYGRHINVLAFISKIAQPSVRLTRKKDEAIARASEKKCKDCDHPHIDHERHQTDSFIHIHDPVQKQHCHSACFRNTLRLQAASDELRLDTDTSGHEKGDTITSYRDHLEMAAENTAWALTDLEKAIVKAHATLDDHKSDREGCQDAHASWKTGLADLETMSKLPRNMIETTLAERKRDNGTSEYSAVMLEKLQQANVELRPELDELNASLEACRIHIAGRRGHPFSEAVTHCGAPAAHSSDDGSSVDASSDDGSPHDAAMKVED